MRETFELLRRERRARIFFTALAQSALGTGASYVALLLIAKDRSDSPWAISLVLLAELIPAMLFGPFFGALADRWSRKSCMIAADVVRAIAFLGIVLVDGLAGTVAFAVLAGVGTGVFTPAALAALPSVVDEERRVPAANALYGVVADLGFTVGPALAAGVIVLGGPELVLYVNSASFAASVLILASVRFGAAPARAPEAPLSILGEVGEGIRTAFGIRPIRILLLGSAAGLFCAGLFNVAEVFFATDEIGASQAGFGLLVAFFGAGFIAGSLVGSTGGPPALLKRRYLAGLAALGLSLLATGAASTYAMVAVTFAFSGFGNGLLLVYERLIILTTVSDRLVGRVFGAKDALTAWAFGIAFLAGGGLVTAIGSRDLIVAAGGLGVVVCAGTAFALRGEWRDDGVALREAGAVAPGLDGRADVARGDGVLGEDGANVVDSGERLRLEALDDAD